MEIKTGKSHWEDIGPKRTDYVAVNGVADTYEQPTQMRCVD
jgi:hypothetical protein